MSGTGACGTEACGCGAGPAQGKSQEGQLTQFCPKCNAQAHPVTNAVLNNILKTESANSYKGSAPNLCLNPECELVYFDSQSKETYANKDCASGVWFKDGAENSYVCYCEGITEREIITTVVQTGLDDLGSVMLYLREKTEEDCGNKQPAGISCNRYFQDAIDKGLVVREALLEYKDLIPDSKEAPYQLIEERYNSYLSARGTTMAEAGSSSGTCCGGGGCGSA